ncbi:MAG: hypothetical protein FWC46_05875 [Actinomycetia bacterium]|nr:hypothetical protein [Actinomycetes bacterium]
MGRFAGASIARVPHPSTVWNAPEILSGPVASPGTTGPDRIDGGAQRRPV